MQLTDRAKRKDNIVDMSDGAKKVKCVRQVWG